MRSTSASSPLILVPLLCFLQTSRISLARPMPRIINGEDAAPGAYPFFASLTKGGEEQVHSCGGTLIAPDMILTAAHCIGLEKAELGRSVLVDPNDNFEVYDLVEEIRHPAYSDDEYDFDFMILKLDRRAPAIVPIIKLNKDDNKPEIGVPEGLTAIGFGVTEFYYDGTHNGAAPWLQEVGLHAITNEECATSRGTTNTEDAYTVGYEGLITPDMLCAEDDVQDTCSGDSGGPLMMQELGEYVQVGVTSWGFGCGDNDFPGVYSRISHQYHWIKMNVCQQSIDPPDVFECDAPTLPPAEDVEATISVTFDDFPGEIQLTLIDDTEYGAVVVEKGEGSFAEDAPQSTVNILVVLKERSTYTFKIDDVGGDGLCCYQPGSYKIYIGTEGSQGEVLASGEGNFGTQSVHQFTIPGAGLEEGESGSDGKDGGGDENGNPSPQEQETPPPTVATAAPTVPVTSSPTSSPTSKPSTSPSASPTVSPAPTRRPTLPPTFAPTMRPTISMAPSQSPTPIPAVKNNSQRNNIIFGVAIVVVVAAMFLATSWYADRHNRIEATPDDTPVVKGDDTELGDEEFGEDPLRTP